MKKKVVILLCAILFFILWFFIITKKITFIDSHIYEYLNFYRSHRSDILFLAITTVLNADVILLLCCIAMIVCKNTNRLLIPINLACSTLVATFLKLLFQRPRPPMNFIEEIGFSFPSAHAFISLSFFGFLWYLFYQNHKNKKGYLALVLTILFILLIGMSRIYLGVHYFSDIIGGYLAGTIYLVGFISFLKKYHYIK